MLLILSCQLFYGMSEKSSLSVNDFLLLARGMQRLWCETLGLVKIEGKAYGTF